MLQLLNIGRMRERVNKHVEDKDLDKMIGEAKRNKHEEEARKGLKQLSQEN